MAIRAMAMIKINIFFRFEGWLVRFRSRKDRIVGFFVVHLCSFFPFIISMSLFSLLNPNCIIRSGRL